MLISYLVASFGVPEISAKRLRGRVPLPSGTCNLEAAHVKKQMEVAKGQSAVERRFSVQKPGLSENLFLVLHDRWRRLSEKPPM